MRESFELHGYGPGEDATPVPPEAMALRGFIIDAYRAGDEVELERLRGQYRHLAHRSTSAPPRTVTRNAPTRAPRRVDLEVEGYVASFGRLSPGETKDGSRVWYCIDRGAFDAWLAQFAAASSIPFALSHDRDLTVGEWRSFEVDEVGLYGVAQVSDDCVGRDVLEATDDGRLPGFSVVADIVRSHERRRAGPGGRRIVDVLELSVQEAGPNPHPLDEGAQVLLVAGHKTMFQRGLDAMARTERLRKMWS